MKLSVSFLVLAGLVAANPAPVLEKRAQPKGIDVSNYQPSINWATVKANGISFAYIKATEGTSTQRLSLK